MTVARLQESAECYIKIMDLWPEEAKSVRTTIQNYAEPSKACCKQLCWLIYLVVQGIKSLFGCSDWQKATRVISNRILTTLIEDKLIIKEKSQKGAKHPYTRYAEEILTLALSAHENKLAVSPDFKLSVKKWDVINLTRKQIKGYTVEEPD